MAGRQMTDTCKFKVLVRIGWDGPDGDFTATAMSEQDPCDLSDGNVDTDLPFRDYVLEIEAPVPRERGPVVTVTLPTDAPPVVTMAVTD